MKKRAEITRFSFEPEGVTIIIPEPESRIAVRKLRLPDLSELPGGTEEFTPKRLVINFEFYDKDKQDVELVSQNLPIEMRVRFVPEDLDRADKKPEKLKLGYFWADKWWVFGEKKHGFHLKPREDDPRHGEGVVTLRTWNDPKVGWGS